MACSVNANLYLPDICFIGGANGMDQLIITGAFSKVGMLTD